MKGGRDLHEKRGSPRGRENTKKETISRNEIPMSIDVCRAPRRNSNTK